MTLQGYIVVPTDNLVAVRSALPMHIELTRKEEGCLVFCVSHDNSTENRFNVYEEFVNRAAFETHQWRVKNSHWDQVTKSVERHYQIREESKLP
ncbi:MAG: antibiotic biosynthesis monooxygenase [Oceanicoccus sp.]